MAITLHQFEFSHFNEKARWALAYKNVPYDRKIHLPGPHMRAIRKLSGQTSTPVLDLGGEIVSGSSEIIDRLEQDYPEPALYPQDPVLREQALGIQREFDAGLGPAVRTAIFSVLVDNGSYLCRMFAGKKSLPVRLGYRALFPVARGLIAKGNGVTPDNVRRSLELIHTTLNEIETQIGSTGYLVGEAFTVADLTTTALLAPIAGVEHPDMKRPQPLPDQMAELVGQFSAHPAIAWTNEIYARHRK